MEKVIIVGPGELHSFFTSYYETWDTQIPVERVSDVWAGLDSGALSPESSVVVFTDAGFEDLQEYVDTVEAVAEFAPEAIVLVIFYDTGNYPQLDADVKQKQAELQKPQIPFFPIDAQSNVGEEIAKAFEYYNTHIVNNPAARPAVSEGYNDGGVVVDPSQVSGDGTAGFTNEVDYADPNARYDAYGNQDPEQKRRGLIVASTSSKGGSGKTTVGMLTAGMFRLASQTAVEQGLRDKPLSVCMVDMDIKDGQIGFIIRQLTPTALNLYLLPEKTPEAIRENLVFDNDLQVNAMLAPKRAMNANYLTPEFYVHVIDQLAEMFDVVVLDTSVDYTDILLSKVVFPMSDAIMFVTNLSIGSVYGMNRWLDEVTSPAEDGGPGISINKIGVVVNQAILDLLDVDLLKGAAAGAEVLVTIPMDSSGIVAASNNNRLSQILKYHPDISAAYYQLIRQLLPNEIFADPLINTESGALNASVVETPEPKKRKRKGLFG